MNVVRQIDFAGRNARASVPPVPVEPQDRYLARWSRSLTLLIAAAALFSIAAPVYLAADGQAFIFVSGEKTWRFMFSDLPWLDRIVFLPLISSTKIVWLYGLYQIYRLARQYRRGQIFDDANARRFVLLGVALAVIGVLDMAVYPIANVFLYWRGISPWLADMPFLLVFSPDYLMAGLFFIILGKIMRRGSDLEERDRSIV
jgi:hypothetical protein